MRKTFLATFVAFGITLAAGSAFALDGYTPAEEQQFMDWCTGAKSATESTCSCTLKRVAQNGPCRCPCILCFKHWQRSEHVVIKPGDFKRDNDRHNGGSSTYYVRKLI